MANFRRVYKIIEKRGHDNLVAVIFDVVNGDGKVRIIEFGNGKYSILL